MATQTYDLRGVTHIVIEQRCPKGWTIRGENPSGIAQAITEQTENYKAHTLAREWCRTNGFRTYRVSTFTGKPYVFRVQTVEVETGKVIDDHEEDYNE